jgi:uncharacterized small protein (DUF1192 family)
MAIDLFAEERPRPRLDRHELGQDLSTLSVEELEERVAILEAEIERLREAKASKSASRDAASAFFKL